VRRALVATVVALACVAGSARAAVSPDPGGAGAWAAGVTLLSDGPGPLLVFDQPARLDPGGARVAIGLARARLFELDELTRLRAAASWTRDAWTAALGAETCGPAAARRARLVLGLALVRGATALGAAWNERRAPGGTDVGRAGSLDAAVATRHRRLALQLSVRGLLAGGDPLVQADPDWTAEAAFDLGPARAHLARTRDLHGARTGGGVALDAGPLAVRAGAVGPPLSWTLGFAVGARAHHAAAHAAYARVVHPELGASDALEGSVAW
jgi:hypothetical protein